MTPAEECTLTSAPHAPSTPQATFLAHPRPAERRVLHHRQVGRPMRRVTSAVHQHEDRGAQGDGARGHPRGDARSGSQVSTRGGSWTSYCAVELQECTQGRVGAADIREHDDVVDGKSLW
ncbi:hypothetical protein FIBSPDRAFT_872469 [Athelia psychrophila]|uniref:Uncharacterized protein n=1 Tax=Athelia psychrophila TaxID=1759441 RepID=A0A165ZH44_9AGAM|nr:hypothetical protein FIBSPDRAFT_872469 [Fibularhizoctonia sp. CBS 109695]